MRRTVLIADDSVTIRKVVELAFADTEIRVEPAASGAEALRKIESAAPDVVLADVVMPEPAGYEICRFVKESSRPVPVVLLAGTFEPFDEARARACGADAHLVKPFDSRTLVEEVRRLLGRADAPAREPAAASQPADEVESLFEDLGPTVPAAPAPEPERADEVEAEPPPVTPEERTLTDADVDAIARRVVERLSDRVLREIAWDVVPDLAETIVRERLRELEKEEREVR